MYPEHIRGEGVLVLCSVYNPGPGFMETLTPDSAQASSDLPGPHPRRGGRAGAVQRVQPGTRVHGNPDP